MGASFGGKRELCMCVRALIVICNFLYHESRRFMADFTYWQPLTFCLVEHNRMLSVRQVGLKCY
jgi:hypothetical protein